MKNCQEKQRDSSESAIWRRMIKDKAKGMSMQCKQLLSKILAHLSDTQ